MHSVCDGGNFMERHIHRNVPNTLINTLHSHKHTIYILFYCQDNLHTIRAQEAIH